MRKTISLNTFEDFVVSCESQINYLTNTVFNKSNHDDIRQEPKMFLLELYQNINNREKQINNLSNYVFIALKNHREYLLRRDAFSKYIIIDESLIKDIALIELDYDDELTTYINEILCQNFTSDQRKLIAMKFTLNLSTYKISKKLGIPQQTISYRINNIILKIRDELKRKGHI